MIREFAPFLYCFLTLQAVLANQFAEERSLCGVASPISNGDSTANHTCLENTHQVTRC
jgi:hypothetical protein